MPQPTAQDVHVSRPLTDLSTAFIQDERKFVAARAFPVVPVQKQADQYFEYTRADWNRDEAKRRAPGTESAGGGFNLTTATYFAHKYALHKDVDDDTRANSDPAINPDNDATRFVTQQLLIRREKEWSTHFASSVWTNEDLVAKAWQTDTNDPIKDIRGAQETVEALTGFRPNVLIIGRLGWDKLIDNATVIDRIKYTQRGIVTAELVAAALELDEVLVGGAIENTAEEGATEVSARIIQTDGALVLWRPPNPGLLTPSAGYHFTWTGLLGAGAFGNRMKRFRMEEIESDRIEGEMAFDAKLVSADLGFWFSNVAD